MKLLPIFAAISLSLTSFASASTLDFRDSAFASSFGGADAAVTVDGVTFTVTPVARGADGFRQNATGLRFGVPGNGMEYISIVASQDVTFESVLGIDTSLATHTTPMLFDGDDGTSRFTGLSFGTSLGSVDFTDFTLAAGDAFVFSADFSARPGFSSIFASAGLQSFEFSSVAAVPLPASAAFLFTALGLLGLRRRPSAKLG